MLKLLTGHMAFISLVAGFYYVQIVLNLCDFSGLWAHGQLFPTSASLPRDYSNVPPLSLGFSISVGM